MSSNRVTKATASARCDEARRWSSKIWEEAAAAAMHGRPPSSEAAAPPDEATAPPDEATGRTAQETGEKKPKIIQMGF